MNYLTNDKSVTVLICFFTEPTNNVAPKKIGAEFGGWRVAYIRQETTVFLTCQVTGFPVPRFL